MGGKVKRFDAASISARACAHGSLPVCDYRVILPELASRGRETVSVTQTMNLQICKLDNMLVLRELCNSS